MAHHKIKQWCAYQERSQHETRQKLYDYGLFSEDVEAIIAKLIEENFLNEERFALALTGGKFRIKRWGRIKIKLELKKHKVSDYLIQKALKSINDKDYEMTIVKIIEKKQSLLKSGNAQKKYYELLSYLRSRGFETDLAVEQLNHFKSENTM